MPILDAGWLARHKLFSTKEVHHLQLGRSSVLEKIACALEESSISAVQLRCKGTSTEAFLFTSLWMQALRTYSPDISIIINDHVDLAMTLAADGVHVGQDDTPVTLCRQMLGPDKIVGLSTHSMAEVLTANQESGDAKGSAPDYIGFGPVFSTNSKPDAQPVQGLLNLGNICRVAQMPVVAIGGIQQSQITEVARMGASAVAMISSLWDAEHWPQLLKQADQHWNDFGDLGFFQEGKS